MEERKEMAEENNIQLFEEQQVRYVWDAEKEKYFFSVVDVIKVLTDTDRPRKYWSDLKHKLESEGSEVSAKIGQLKLLIHPRSCLSKKWINRIKEQIK